MDTLSYYTDDTKKTLKGTVTLPPGTRVMMAHKEVKFPTVMPMIIATPLRTLYMAAEVRTAAHKMVFVGCACRCAEDCAHPLV